MMPGSSVLMVVYAGIEQFDGVGIRPIARAGGQLLVGQSLQGFRGPASR